MSQSKKPVKPHKSLDFQIKETVEAYRNLRKDSLCYPLLIRQSFIGPRLVDDVYEELLQQKYKCDNGNLVIIIDSSGGDIDAAYNLASLFRDIGSNYLEFVIPRWAKSAATLLACCGNKISMTPIAELGPVDPQITVFNPLEKRMEEFSPLHIDSTLSLIRKEYQNGHQQMADKLMERLQFPLTLGSYKKSIEISKGYLETLLGSRMLKDDKEKAKDIAKKLTEGYADHGACINAKEAINIGLKVDIIEGDQRQLIWNLHRLSVKKSDQEANKKREQMKKTIKDLPPGILNP